MGIRPHTNSSDGQSDEAPVEPGLAHGKDGGRETQALTRAVKQSVASSSRGRMMESLQGNRHELVKVVSRAAESAERSRQMDQAFMAAVVARGPQPTDAGLPDRSWAELSSMAKLMVELAESVKGIAQVAITTSTVLDRMLSEEDATLTETHALRAALERGQLAADRANKALGRLTTVLVALTSMLVVLTAVLLVRA